MTFLAADPPRPKQKQATPALNPISSQSGRGNFTAMASSISGALLFIAALAASPHNQCTSFNMESAVNPRRSTLARARPSSIGEVIAEEPSAVLSDTSLRYEIPCQMRRSILIGGILSTVGTIASANVAIASGGKLDETLAQIKEANDQLDSIPDLIKAEQWDAGKFKWCITSCMLQEIA